MNFYEERLKRPLDLFGSATLLIASAPLTAVIAIAIRSESSGEILYKQERVGRDGKPFRILKFRSMLRPQDSYGADGKLLSNYERVTRVGRLIRASSLDELPQLINVLKGEMSLIGPRPTLPYQVERYTESQKVRLEVRPGLTGLAQVSGRNALSWTEKIEKDLEYVRRISMLLDLKILLRTVLVVFRQESIAFDAHDDLSAHKGGDSSTVWNVGGHAN